MGESKLLKDIIGEIERIAEELKIPSYQLNKARFKELSKVSDWTLRKFGGYTTILNTYFPMPNKELKDIELNRERKLYVQRLEKKYGSWEAFQQQLTDSLVKQLSKIKIEPLVFSRAETQQYLKDYLVPSPSGDQEKRSLCSIWSDQHYGTNVDKEELGGLNEFNWVVGARRLGLLCEQLASYKIERRNLHEEVVIMLAGDNIGGVIHNQEGPDYDLTVHQINGTLFYYIQALNYLKNFFPTIRVLCQVGNHGRFQHKLDKGRSLAQKYDSFENIIFYALSSVFARDSRISIETSKSPYVDSEIQGHRIWMSHGDTVFSVGNVGKKIDLEKIEHQIHRINAEALAKGRKPFELFATGHVHHPVVTQVGPGVRVVINGCLIGSDNFAQSIGIFSSTPTQVIWETTKKHVLGDNRQIFVADADTNPHYDSIIKPFRQELIAPKLI